ncbi:N-acetylmuramoyl-L-alanine amidase [Candidatus Woesebacteria bacterium]|nr:N-acetylmuramoyl-L-alanine amidase [Candidatus Woesebacteria bacterium]
MKIVLLFSVLFLFSIGGILCYRFNTESKKYGAPPYILDDLAPIEDFSKYGDLSKWVRPEGPVRVGLQAGHWKNSELPDELERLRENGGGTSNGSVAEWEVNLSVAEATKELLEKEGILVDILPATIPPGYFADAVIAIHADGSLSPAASGFKVAAPRRDESGKASTLVLHLEENYQSVTKLPKDPNITRNMTGYYAFSWRRFEHSTHPMAPAVILETGFLTNPSDARMLIRNPQLPAKAIAQALLAFLNTDKKVS